MTRPTSYRFKMDNNQLIRYNGTDGEFTLTPTAESVEGLVDAIRCNVSIVTLRMRCIPQFITADLCLQKLWCAFPMNQSIQVFSPSSRASHYSPLLGTLSPVPLPPPYPLPGTEGALVSRATFWATSDSYPCFLGGFYPSGG